MSASRGPFALSDERRGELEAFSARLGHCFKDLALLNRALTHSSYANEDRCSETRHNESLEFLGDAVLGFVVSDLLHRNDPDGDEGSKSFTRAALVSSESLARHAAELRLPELLQLGRGEEKTGGRQKTALWADALEAVVATLYLDGGLETTCQFIQCAFGQELASKVVPRDHKSALQELLQGQGDPLPEYLVVAEDGPSHCKSYTVCCVVNGREVSEGKGSSKKQAQQEAAQKALALLRPLPAAEGSRSRHRGHGTL